jgi:OOP family OmpA-OmpF porin
MAEQTSEDLIPLHSPDSNLAEALSPLVVAAMKESVQKAPREWAETLAPILLPAIRMAVASALRDMLATMNQLLEHSFSPKSWRYRVEAWRTGRTFAEVVLLRTMLYRVEQVILLDRHAGLLLASVSAPDIKPKSADLISAMLTALQDFVGDSFGVDHDTGIRELHVGDFSLLIEQGSRAAVVAAVRGNAPVELRETLRAAIDLIHQEFGTELRNFKGDAKPFVPTRTILEGCLLSRYETPTPASYRKLWCAAAALIASGVIWVGFRVETARRSDRALAALRNARGIAVTHSSTKSGHLFVEGLRDPVAASPESLLAAAGIDVRRVSVLFQPFLSLDPEIVVQRARTVLEAPPEVLVSLDGERLRLAGTAAHDWILKARSSGKELSLAGIRGVQTDELIDSDLESLRAEIEAGRIAFPSGSSEITPDEARIGMALARKALLWTNGALEIGRSPRLDVIGYTDATGLEHENRNLRRARAAQVAEMLVAQGIDRQYLVSKGVDQLPGSAADGVAKRVVVIQTRWSHSEASSVPGR